MNNQPRLYECTQCTEKFLGIKEYISHLDKHKQLIDNMPPEKKQNLLQKLFAREKPKQEEKKMENKQESHMGNINVNEVREIRGKIDSIERAIKQMSDMMVHIGYRQQTPRPGMYEDPLPPLDAPDLPPVVEESPAEESDDGVEKRGGNKRLKVTVIVPEKQSGDFLKFIQESKYYDMEDITIHTRK
jgi:hypothetical protein